jgi:hypothetical protein
LLASLPRIDRRRAELYSHSVKERLRKQPSGCTFHPRCGLVVSEKRHRDAQPELIATGDNHRVACHFWQRLQPGLNVKLKTIEAKSLPPLGTCRKGCLFTLKVDNLHKTFKIAEAVVWALTA